MANYTTNLSLKKPVDAEGFDIQDFNGNAEKIDAAFGSNFGQNGAKSVSQTIDVKTVANDSNNSPASLAAVKQYILDENAKAADNSVRPIKFTTYYTDSVGPLIGWRLWTGWIHRLTANRAHITLFSSNNEDVEIEYNTANTDPWRITSLNSKMAIFQEKPLTYEANNVQTVEVDISSKPNSTYPSLFIIRTSMWADGETIGAIGLYRKNGQSNNAAVILAMNATSNHSIIPTMQTNGILKIAMSWQASYFAIDVY